MKGKILVIAVGLALGLLVSEIAIRLLPPEITKIDSAIAEEERIFSASRSMRFRPNLTRVWTGLGRPTIWHFNELGYRERSIQLDKPENIYRIVFLGDSVVMGFGVEEYESWPRRLENALRPTKLESNMTHFEVLNLGIQGFSSPQYKALIKEDVLRMDPDLILVGYYANDTLEAASFDANRKYMFLKSIPDMVPFKLNHTLKKHSHLYLMLLTRYYTSVESLSVAISPNEEEVNHGWSVTQKDFQEIKELAEEQGVKVVLLGIPSSTEEVKIKQLSKRRASELTKVAEVNQFIYYEMYNDILGYKGNLADLYLEDFNDHFNKVGTEYAAGLVAKFLRTQEIIPAI